MATTKYKTSSHLTGADSQPIASGSIVTAEELGDKETVERYKSLGVIETASKEDLTDIPPVVGGSIVESSPARAEEVAEEAADKSPAAVAKDGKK